MSLTIPARIAFASGLASLGSLPLMPVACGPISSTVGSAIVTGFSLACPEEVLIPSIGAELAAACVGQEFLVRAAIAAAEAVAPTGDAGAPRVGTAAAAMTSATTGAGVRLGAPLFAGPASARRHVGRCPCDWSPAKVAAAQAWIDSQPDGGR